MTKKSRESRLIQGVDVRPFGRKGWQWAIEGITYRWLTGGALVVDGPDGADRAILTTPKVCMAVMYTMGCHDEAWRSRHQTPADRA